jgi:hypothetical protein
MKHKNLTGKIKEGRLVTLRSTSPSLFKFKKMFNFEENYQIKYTLFGILPTCFELIIS